MKSTFKGSYFSYILIFFFFFFCMAAFSAVLSVYLTGQGISVVHMSRIISAGSLFAFVISPITGYICDRTGKPRQVNMVMMLLVGILSILFAKTKNVYLLFILNGLIMSFIHATQPSCERLAGASKYRYGILRVWGTVGYACGAQLAGLALEKLPSMALFVSVLIAAVLCAVGLAGANDPLMPEKTSEAEKSEGKSRLSSFLTNRYYLMFVLITVLFWGCSGANMTYVPVLLTSLGVPASSVGTVIFFSTLVEIPLILFSNRFMDKFNGKTLILFACALTLTEFLVFGLVNSSVAVMAVVIGIKAIATTTYVMIQLKIVRNLVPADLTTTALALIGTGNSIGTILMQNLGGIVTETYSVQSFYLIMAGLIVLTMVICLFFKVSNEQKVFG
ncbi:MAG: MFS transporter [Firmicutes bacterium]|nr:MFS transporter [Bacillota bacterium]